MIWSLAMVKRGRNNQRSAYLPINSIQARQIDGYREKGGPEDRPH
jgi:hypothetical protein